MNSILLKNGTVITDKSVELQKDVLLEDGVVKALDHNIGIKAQQEIDCSGCYIMPSAIDPHVHLREPGQTWKEDIASGTAAALAGGISVIGCMPNTSPAIDHKEVVSTIIRRAREVSAVKVLPFAALTVGRKGTKLAPLYEMFDAGAVAFTDDGSPVEDCYVLRRALEIIGDLGSFYASHEEVTALTVGGAMNEGVVSHRLGYGGIPKASEEICIGKEIELSRLTGTRIHFLHVTSGRSIEMIRRAKADGINVTCEVCPHNLIFTDEDVAEYGTLLKMNPPLRTALDRELLWGGIADGTVDFIATDHAPHEADTKRVPFDEASFGITGLQTFLTHAFSFVKQQKFSLERLVELTCVNARKLLGEKNTLAVGERCDITVFDPQLRWTLNRETNRSKSSNSPWFDKELVGKAKWIYINGSLEEL